MNRSKNKKKQIMKKIRKATKGAISLMLCILITPFLTMAGALIELSRYQMAAETLQEAIDSSMLSVLAEYDGFLEDRFALFAVSQDIDMTDEFNKYLVGNSGVLGQAVKVNSASLDGKFSLSTNGSTGSYDVLQSQLLDFSETTVATEMVLKNLKLEELIEKLQAITGFGELSDLASKVEVVTTDLKELVEKSEDLYNTAKSLKDNFEKIKGDISTINQQIISLFNKIQSDLSFNINDYNIVIESGGVFLERKEPLDEDDGKNRIDILAELRDSEYKSYFSTISSKAKGVVDSINSMKGDIEKLPDKINEVKTKLSDVKSSIANLSSKRNEFSSSDDTAEKNASEKTKDLQDAYNDIINDFEEALSGIGDDLVEGIKSDFNAIVDDFKNTVFSELEIDNLNSIPKNTIELVLRYFKENSDHSFDGFMKFFLDNSPISNLISSLTSMPDKLRDAATKAKENIKKGFTQNLIDSLKAIGRAIKNLFGLQGIVDTDLNAFIDDEVWDDLGNGNSNNPYQGFLDALSELISGFNDLSPSNWNGNPFKALLNALKGVLKIFTSVGKMFKNILDLIGEKVTSVVQFVSDFGNLSNMGDRLLMSGYMLYNLPNRLNYKSGTALTGFPYSQIPRDSTGYDDYNITYDNENPFTAINNFVNGLNGKSGLNNTFVGAEAEYIIGGTQSELANQLFSFMELYFMRLLLDLPAVFSDPNVSSMAGAANIFAWVVYLIVIIAEPICDTILLVNGGKVDLIKKNCYMTPVGIGKYISKLGECGLNGSLTEALQNESNNINFGDGYQRTEWDSSDIWPMGYEDYLLISMIIFEKREQVLSRFADIVQMEAAKYYNKPSFTLDKSYTCVSCNASVSYYPFISILENAGLTNFTVDYEQDRNY